MEMEQFWIIRPRCSLTHAAFNPLGLMMESLIAALVQYQIPTGLDRIYYSFTFGAMLSGRRR